MRYAPLKNAVVATSLVLISSATYALPVVTHSVSGAGTQADQSAPVAAETAYQGTLDSGYVTEDFEGFAGGERNTLFDTAAGSFTQVIAGQGGLCETLPDGCGGGLAVLDAGTTVYSDRYPVSGTKWLDNAGTSYMIFAPIAGINSIGFFAADLRDHLLPVTFSVLSGGELIELDDIFEGTPESNAQLRYVTITSSEDIDLLAVWTQTNAEGYGIDNVTAGRVTTGAPLRSSQVPEPGALGLLAVGLLGAAALRRRRALRS